MWFIVVPFILSGVIGSIQGNLNSGDNAPDFTLKDYSGKNHSLSDYKGKMVALYFYPKDDTPGCTAEACNLRDNYKILSEKGIIILGISYDSPESHTQFIEKYSLPFVLLSDSDKKVAKLYYAEGLITAKRITYLIDGQGKIVHIFDQVSTSDHAAQILEVIEKR
jgi:thioredoxin-dependent peroxiredoxin